MRGRTLVGSTLILLLMVMLVFVGPFAAVSRTYALLPENKTAYASPNPAILGSFVTVWGGGFQHNCGPPGSGAPCIFEIVFVPGGGCRQMLITDQVGPGGSGMGVLGFAPEQLGDHSFLGNLFFATTDSNGAFNMRILLGDTFSATNYSIEGFDGKNMFCIDPFTIILQVCVIQIGVEQSAAAVLWLPGYAYPDLHPSSCPDVTEYYVDGSGVYGGMIVFHQFVQNRTYYSEPLTLIFA